MPLPKGLICLRVRSPWLNTEGLCSFQLLLLSENEYLEWNCSEHQAASLISTAVVPLLASFLPLGRAAICNFQAQVLSSIKSWLCSVAAEQCCAVY